MMACFKWEDTSHSVYSSHEANPVLIPGKHVALLLIRHHHATVKRQGRHITEGAVRSSALWIVGGKTAAGKYGVRWNSRIWLTCLHSACGRIPHSYMLDWMFLAPGRYLHIAQEVDKPRWAALNTCL